MKRTKWWVKFSTVSAFVICLNWFFEGQFAFSQFKPALGTAIIPAGVDREAVFDKSISIISANGYQITHSDRKTGTVNSSKKAGDATIILNMVIEESEGEKILVHVTKQSTGGDLSALMPPSLIRRDILSIVKVLVKSLNIDESTVLLRFGNLEKPLTSY